MRKLLLASAAAIALLTTQPARADLPVIDAAAIGHLLESIGIEGEQLTQLIETYAEVVQVYDMTTNVWNSVAQIVGVDSWAPELTGDAARNPLPFAAADHPAWVGGFNDPSGLPYGAQYVSQSTVGGNPSVYNDGTFPGTEILKAIRSTAAIQAVATNHVASIENRIIGLNNLFTQLASIGTIQQTDSLSARLHNELNYANTQQIQATQIMNAALLQRDVRENNQLQWAYQDEAIGIQSACNNVAAAGGFITIPACNGAGGAGGINAAGTLFTGVPGLPGAGQALGNPLAAAPGGFLAPGTNNAVNNNGAPAAFLIPGTNAPINTGGTGG